MFGFPCNMAPEMLLDLVHERQSDLRREFESARLTGPWLHRAATALRAVRRMWAPVCAFRRKDRAFRFKRTGRFG
jgi:hypothetical protein